MPEHATTSWTMDLNDLVPVLSEAIGLTGHRIVNHGRRVAYIALSLADTMSLAPTRRNDLWIAALLHDAGVSRIRTYTRLRQLDWEGTDEHCRTGATRLGAVPLFSRAARLVRYHHSPWPALANLIFLADRVDMMLDWDTNLLLNRDRIVGRISELSGEFFNSGAVDALKENAGREVFWLSLYPRHLPQALARFKPLEQTLINLDDLECIAAVFADIVDSKNKFTQGHSSGVARLCDYFARAISLDSGRIQKLRIAGLFHDLGKLSVPDRILEKPSALSPDEFLIVKRHPLETWYVLNQLPGLPDLRDWSAFHHETLDGSGYPFHRTRWDFSMEHVIVMLSDKIQALVQDRPHRPGKNPDHMIEIIGHMAARNVMIDSLWQTVRHDCERIINLAEKEDPT